MFRPHATEADWLNKVSISIVADSKSHLTRSTAVVVAVGSGIVHLHLEGQGFPKKRISVQVAGGPTHANISAMFTVEDVRIPGALCRSN